MKPTSFALRLLSFRFGAPGSSQSDVRRCAGRARRGHLREGGSASLLAGETIGEPGPLIERLTDAIEVSQAGTREMLRLVMRDARPAANGSA